MIYFIKKIKKELFPKSFRVILCLSLVILFLDNSTANSQSIYSKTTGEVVGVSALMSAIVSNDIEGVKFFIKSGGGIVNQRNYGGATALHIAVRKQNIEIIKILIENDANIDVEDNEKWTPLMRAALAGNAEIVSILLDNGAQGDRVNSVDESIIFQATTSGCNDCLEVLFKKFNFPKYVNIQKLQYWLNDSYSVARNKNNEVGQRIIAKYLDDSLEANRIAVEDRKKNYVEGALGKLKMPSNANYNEHQSFHFTESNNKENDSELLEMKIMEDSNTEESQPTPVKFFRFTPKKRSEVQPLETVKSIEIEVEKEIFLAPKQKPKKFKFSKGKAANSIIKENTTSTKETIEKPKKKFLFWSKKAASKSASEEIKESVATITEEKTQKSFKFWKKISSEEVAPTEGINSKNINDELISEKKHPTPKAFNFKKGGPSIELE